MRGTKHWVDAMKVDVDEQFTVWNVAINWAHKLLIYMISKRGEILLTNS